MSWFMYCNLFYKSRMLTLQLLLQVSSDASLLFCARHWYYLIFSSKSVYCLSPLNSFSLKWLLSLPSSCKYCSSAQSLHRSWQGQDISHCFQVPLNELFFKLLLITQGSHNASLLLQVVLEQPVGNPHCPGHPHKITSHGHSILL